jgi:hypothetical protein
MNETPGKAFGHSIWLELFFDPFVPAPFLITAERGIGANEIVCSGAALRAPERFPD